MHTKSLFPPSGRCLMIMALLCLNTFAANPYLPLWEHIPDGEPYVFDDPDRPGEKRVYIYGSHDSMRDGYCGRELVLWSATPEDLNRWRYDGILFESKHDAQGNLLHKDGHGDVLYAPDVCEVSHADGTKTYYLYPNNQSNGRKSMIAKASRPDGPFKICNWSKDTPYKTEGCLDFDPAVFIDDDGRVYGYWGINTSWAAELDPQTMATVKPGTQIVKDLISGKNQEGIFRFFEASSIRKIEGKYILIYSRWTADGEFGLPESNYTLAYAYADAPLGPYHYGGTIIDARGRDTDPQGKAIFTATPNGNTHGSIAEIEGRWYIFYHRQTGTDEYARQAMVAPIEIEVSEGKVIISEGEYTSEGFELNGLNPYQKHSAGIACHYTGPQPAIHRWPTKEYSGSYVAATYLEELQQIPQLAPETSKSTKKSKRHSTENPDNTNNILSPEKMPQICLEKPYDPRVNHNPLINNLDKSIIGYKYFNFDKTQGQKNLRCYMELVPLGQNGRIDIYTGNPTKGGKKLGHIKLSKKMEAGKMLRLSCRVPKLSRLQGKHALFFAIHCNAAPDKASAKNQKTPPASLCDIHYFGFE